MPGGRQVSFIRSIRDHFRTVMVMELAICAALFKDLISCNGSASKLFGYLPSTLRQ